LPINIRVAPVSFVSDNPVSGRDRLTLV